MNDLIALPIIQEDVGPVLVKVTEWWRVKIQIPSCVAYL